MKKQLEKGTRFEKEFHTLAYNVGKRFNHWVETLGKTFDGEDVLGFIRENASTDYEVPATKITDRHRQLFKPSDIGEGLGKALGRIFNNVEICSLTTTDRIDVLFDALEATGKEEADLSIDVHANAMRVNVKGKALIELHAWTPTKRRIKSRPHSRPPIPSDIYFRIPPEVKAFLCPERHKELIGWHYDWTQRPNRHKIHGCANSQPYAFFLAGVDNATWAIRESDGFDQLVIEVHEYRPRMSAVQYVINLL